MPHRVVIRNKLGQFMPLAKRYEADVAMIQVVRHKRYTTVAERPLPPQDLANVLSQPEFESLPEAVKPIKSYTSGKKYKAWDIAEQIDATRGLRRKDLKLTVRVMDGDRQRKVVIYHKIKRNTKSSYALFRRINQELGLEGFYIYNRVGQKILADRTGKQVHLLEIEVERVL